MFSSFCLARKYLSPSLLALSINIRRYKQTELITKFKDILNKALCNKSYENIFVI